MFTVVVNGMVIGVAFSEEEANEIRRNWIEENM